MTPNKPDGPGWWYKAWVNKIGELDLDWVIVRVSFSKDDRLMWKQAAGPYYVDDPEDIRNTYWERVPSPSWERAE